MSTTPQPVSDVTPRSLLSRRLQIAVILIAGVLFAGTVAAMATMPICRW